MFFPAGFCNKEDPSTPGLAPWLFVLGGTTNITAKTIPAIVSLDPARPVPRLLSNLASYPENFVNTIPIGALLEDGGSI